jgi:hypothetical protein
MKHVLIAAALVGGLAACNRSGGEPEAVLQEFAMIGETGKCERVPELITKASRDMLGAMLESACKSSMEMRKADPSKAEKKIKRINVLEKTENGDKTTVRAEPEFEDGSKETAQNFVMAKEDGEWKIDLIATGQGMMGAAGAPQ